MKALTPLKVDFTELHPCGLRRQAAPYQMRGICLGNAEVIPRLTHNCLGGQVGEDVASATFNVVNQLQALTAGGEAVIHGQLDEPGTVTIGRRTTRTDAQNRFALAVPVTTGTNQLTVVSTDVNTNSTTNTATFVVANSGSRTFTYDLNGNTTDDGQRAYEWDAENRLEGATINATSALLYPHKLALNTLCH